MMNHETRSDIVMQLLLHEKEESVWRAELTVPVPLSAFEIDDFLTASNLILSECSPNFAVQCGYSFRHDFIGTPINRFVFGRRIEDVVVHNGPNFLPHIIKFVSIHGDNGSRAPGYLNSVGLETSDSMLIGMLGRRRDITFQLKLQDERRALQNSLTAKEFEIFLALVRGNTVKQIASLCGLMEKTVYFHLENIGKKMHAYGMMEIVIKAYRLGFLEPTDVR